MYHSSYDCIVFYKGATSAQTAIRLDLSSASFTATFHSVATIARLVTPNADAASPLPTATMGT